MAIIFSKALSEEELLNSHNINTVEFYSDNILTAVKCTLDFGDVSLEITPSPTGVFDYNLRHATKSLLNANNYIDQVLPDIEANGYVYQDTTLYRLISLVYTIEFDNETTETTTKNYRFTKSVKQPERYAETILMDSFNLGLLLPFVDYSAKSHLATYFMGYPFDVPIWSNIAREVIITNKANDMTYNVNLNQGANRLFFADGTNNFSFDDVLPLIFGVNELEFANASSPDKVRTTLFLNKRENNCGVYLRFYSAWGGYNYWLFDEVFQEDISTKIIDVLQPAFSSIEEASDQDGITGKNSQTLKSIFTEYLTGNEMNYLRPLVDSPRVELYVQDVFTKAAANSWRGVTLRDGTYRTDNTKKALKRLQAQIGYTNNVMSL